MQAQMRLSMKKALGSRPPTVVSGLVDFFCEGRQLNVEATRVPWNPAQPCGLQSECVKLSYQLNTGVHQCHPLRNGDAVTSLDGYF